MEERLTFPSLSSLIFLLSLSLSLSVCLSVCALLFCFLLSFSLSLSLSLSLSPSVCVLLFCFLLSFSFHYLGPKMAVGTSGPPAQSRAGPVACFARSTAAARTVCAVGQGAARHAATGLPRQCPCLGSRKPRGPAHHRPPGLFLG